MRGDVLEYLHLAAWLVDRHVASLLMRPISFDDRGPLIEQLDKPAVELVDPVAASRQRARMVIGTSDLRYRGPGAGAGKISHE